MRISQKNKEFDDLFSKILVLTEVLIDYYTKKLLELKPELKNSEQLIFEGFYQDEDFLNVVNFERL